MGPPSRHLFGWVAVAQLAKQDERTFLILLPGINSNLKGI